MIFGNTVFGKNFLIGKQEIQPFLTNYTKMTFYGQNSGAVYDRIWGKTLPMSNDLIESYNNKTIWTNETYLLALFENTLSAGNIVGFTNKITDWILYREDTESNALIYLTTVGADIFSFKDYTALMNKTYRYYLFASNSQQTSSALVTNYELSKYYGYYVINITDNVVYIINAEVSGGELTQNMNYSKFDGNTRYSSYNVGNTRYMSSTITGVIRRADKPNYRNATDVEILKEFEEFIYNPNKIKYLKTRKGEIFEVFTYNYQQTPLSQAIGEQPTLVTFSYDEIGGVNNGQ